MIVGENLMRVADVVDEPDVIEPVNPAKVDDFTMRSQAMYAPRNLTIGLGAGWIVLLGSCGTDQTGLQSTCGTNQTGLQFRDESSVRSRVSAAPHPGVEEAGTLSRHLTAWGIPPIPFPDWAEDAGSFRS